MPKNIILKDNIPKIEEIRIIESDFDKSQQVREIENQIPTYEEFMKSYNQGQVNYEDLTHENISSNRGFGPCSWNNPDCECYLSERFIPLYVSCSTSGQNCSNTTPTTWFHLYKHLATDTNRGMVCGNLIISHEGRIKCTACQIENDWKEWQFACSNHRGVYNSFSRSEFISSLCVSNNLLKNSGHIRKIIMEKLIDSVMKNR